MTDSPIRHPNQNPDQRRFFVYGATGGLGLLSLMLSEFDLIGIVTIPILIATAVAPGFLFPRASIWGLALAASLPQLARIAAGVPQRPTLLLALPASYLVTAGLVAAGQWLASATYVKPELRA